MKWSPQAVVAVVLSLSIIVAMCSAVLIRYLGHDPTDMVADMWKYILGGIVGALSTYIGGGGPRNGNGKE